MLCLALAAASASAWPAYAHFDQRRATPIVRAAAPIPRQAAVPQPDPAAPDPGVIKLQQLTPDAARLWNASIPISTAPNPAARPFRLAAAGVLDERRAIDCMTAAVYYEAGFESVDGERAVAQVVVNRLRNPLFPKTVCGVVFQGAEKASGCQFTFACDGALGRKPQEDAWARARKVAVAALHGYVMRKVGNATHYHADYVAPYWSPSLMKVAVVGQHIFYRWTGGLGLPPAFGGHYAGGEMKGLKIALLDKLGHGAAEPDAAPDTVQAAPPPQVAIAAAPAPAAKPAAVAQAPVDLVTPDQLAQDAGALTKSDDLDWQGRPRQKGPSHVAVPSPGLGAF